MPISLNGPLQLSSPPRPLPGRSRVLLNLPWTCLLPKGGVCLIGCVKSLSFDGLSEVQFEEFCYDLLVRLGAKNVSWRKGTGYNSSPSDQGRDIECSFTNEEPDGGQRQERWFVECKHHKEGVPPAKIMGALAWATAERPDVLLLIASNAFSNPCKIYLQQFKETNRPQFRLKVWEFKDLETFTVGKPDLLRKYGLAEDYPFLQLLHPTHIEFMRGYGRNTLKFFFAVLDAAGPQRFREAWSLVSLLIVKPEVRLPVDPNETLGDLIQTPVGYVAFRQKCFELARTIDEQFLVRAIVNALLWSAFDAGDKTKLDRVLNNNKSMISGLEEERKANPAQAEDLSQAIETVKSQIAKIPERLQEGYEAYCVLCDEVVTPLLGEQIPFSPELLARMEQLTGKDFPTSKESDL